MTIHNLELLKAFDYQRTELYNKYNSILYMMRPDTDSVIRMLPDIRPNIHPDTGLQAGHRISSRIPDTKPDTGLQAGYQIPSQIPDTKPDTGYQAGYQIASQIPDTKPDTRYQAKYRMPSRIPDTGYRIPDTKPDTGYQAGHRIPGQTYGRILEIWPGAGYLAKYPDGYRISGRIPHLIFDTRTTKAGYYHVQKPLKPLPEYCRQDFGYSVLLFGSVP